MKKYLLALTLLLMIPVPSFGATINASTCAPADVQTAVTAAAPGDTVVIPNGVCPSWGASYVSVDKQITVQGGGDGVTTITVTGSWVFLVGYTTPSAVRITGMTLNCASGQSCITIDGDGWIIDHITFNSNTVGGLCDGFHARGNRLNTAHGPTGLAHHVNFVDCRPLISGYPDTTLTISSIWSSASNLGTTNKVIIEDFTITKTGGQPNGIDCNYGGSFVLRMGTVTGTSVDSHPNQGQRACRDWEVYGLTVNMTAPYFGPLFIRGGSGVIFDFTASAGWTFNTLWFDNRRSFESVPAMGQCTGTNVVDGNQHVSPSADAGWPCRDQIGRGQDAFLWTDLANPPAQANQPAYLWNVSIGGSPGSVQGVNGTAAWIQPNRDYFEQAGASCSGASCSSGVGRGTLANRPASCTVDTGYWATDQGEWNTSNPGNDGQLYRCISTNTWSLFYKPSTYPDPRQGVAAPIPHIRFTGKSHMSGTVRH